MLEQAHSPLNMAAYRLQNNSFSLAFGTPAASSISVEMAPLPIGQSAYFVVGHGVPGADAFFVSTSPYSPGGVPLLDKATKNGLHLDFELGYAPGTLNSTDLTKAAGTYAYDKLTRFGFNVWLGFPDNVALGISFTELQILVSFESEW